jgi:glutathione S-transferase
MIDLYELAGADPSIRFSPYCWRIRMALAHKGVRARLLPWHFGDKKLPGGNKQVPVMVDDGTVIADSTAIALHLENKYHSGPSLFGGEGGEAHARFIIAWTDSVLHGVLLPVVTPALLGLVKPDMRQQFRESREKRMGMTIEAARTSQAALIEKASAAMAPLRQVLKHNPFLGGEEPSYADYTVFGAFQWIRCASNIEVLAAGDPIGTWRDSMLDLFGDLARGAKLAA